MSTTRHVSTARHAICHPAVRVVAASVAAIGFAAASGCSRPRGVPKTGEPDARATLPVSSPTQAAQESVVGRGIFAAKQVLLFGEVRRCTAEEELPMAQVFASSNDGKSWRKQGPALEGSGLEFAHATADGVWILGSRIAEGPGLNPFLLVPTGNEGWTLRRIYDGPDELLGGELRSPSTVLVWIRHSTVHDDERRGPVYLHRSDDGGTSWKTVRRSTVPTAHAPSLFEPITNQSGDWQLVDRDEGGFDIQHRAGNSWQTVSAFPLQPCPEPLGNGPSNADP